METKANYLLIGVTSLLGFLGLLGFILWFANLELNRQFAYYDVYFPEVSGLSIASDVRFAGIPVGSVVDIQLSDRDDSAVRVRLELRDGTPVRADSTAGLSPQGVTGTVAVSISPGTPDAPLLRAVADRPVPEIEPSRSVLQTLTDEGPQIIERLSQIADDLTVLLGDENQSRVANILDNFERTSGNLDQAIADVSAATGAIGAVAGDIAAFGSRLEGLGDAVTVTLSNADAALESFTAGAARANDLMDSGIAALDEVQSFVAGDLRNLSRQVEATAAAVETGLAGFDETMTVGRDTLAAAERAFESAERVMDTQIGPVAGDLRTTLASLDSAIDAVVADLPEITGRFRNAAEAASRTFESLDVTVQALRPTALAFARDGLPQFTRVATELRTLVGNIDGFVTALRRNPSQILSGERTPEFRR